VASPGEFLPLAEETGHVGAIDEWVLRTACRQAREWQALGLPPLRMAANMSLARFDPERILAMVEGALAESGLSPDFLEIEFTESQVFADEPRARLLLEKLQQLGVRTALDDFGTGWSNLGYLARYRFDTLKVDRAFVSRMTEGPRHDALVQAIVAMAGALDLHVVGEGVETAEEAARLCAHGCPHQQGFHHARPMSADDFAAMLAARAE
jgi:EAL domain-containing protein (putative c-di-GMP-specific phosphodiesterase class I)